MNVENVIKNGKYWVKSLKERLPMFKNQKALNKNIELVNAMIDLVNALEMMLFVKKDTEIVDKLMAIIFYRELMKLKPYNEILQELEYDLKQTGWQNLVVKELINQSISNVVLKKELTSLEKSQKIIAISKVKEDDLLPLLKKNIKDLKNFSNINKTLLVV